MLNNFHTIYREEWGHAVAYISRLSGDLSIAEDCVQDAFEAAFSSWKKNGVPDKPGAWIRVAAKRRFIDAARSSRSYRDALCRIEYLSGTGEMVELDMEAQLIKDDDLALIFLCCHPSIKPTDQVMLTLRIVAGLKPREIAAAFYANEEAIRTRLLRAKRKIKGAKIPIVMPTEETIGSRLAQVLAAIYLIFNEGYLSSRGDTAGRPDLVKEATRLALNLTKLKPDYAETYGLLALILFTDARSNARITEEELLVPLDEQNRSLWDKQKIEQGFQYLYRAYRMGAMGRYQCQAAISAEHCKAKNADATDWDTIVKFYDLLLDIEDSPICRLNRCVAKSFQTSPAHALKELELIEKNDVLKNHYSVWAVRADLYRRLGRKVEAVEIYKRVLTKVDNKAVQEFVNKRIIELGRSFK